MKNHDMCMSKEYCEMYTKFTDENLCRKCSFFRINHNKKKLKIMRDVFKT